MTRKISILVLIAILSIACRSNALKINVTFGELSGLQKGDRVLFQENTAGLVKDIQFNTDRSYTVVLEIDEGFSNAVTEYSQFVLVDDPKADGHKGIQIELSQEGGTPLSSGTSVEGTTPEKDLATRLQEDLEAGISFFKERLDQIGRELQGFPESREYQDLKKSLEELAIELGRKEAQAREKIKKEWLPKIQRELDELRERLKKMGREKELAPLEQEMERIRRI